MTPPDPPAPETPLPSASLPSRLSSAQADEQRARSIRRARRLRAWAAVSGHLGTLLSNLGPPFEGPGCLVVREEPAMGQNHTELVSE